MENLILFIAKEFKFFESITEKYLPSHLKHLAQDAAQDAILKALSNIEKFNNQNGNLKSWLFKLTQNICFDYHRKYKNEKLIPINNLEFKLTNDKDFSFEFHSDEIEERSKIVMNALKQLNQRDQEIIKCKFLLNYSGKELAKLLSIPEKHIHIYVKRAKAKLIQIINAA